LYIVFLSSRRGKQRLPAKSGEWFEGRNFRSNLGSLLSLPRGDAVCSTAPGSGSIPTNRLRLPEFLGQTAVNYAHAMPLLFSYGTLQQENVQLSTLGRLLNGQSDELLMFEQSFVRIEDPHVVATIGKTYHANVKFNGNEESRVPGMVFEVTEVELARVDEYEVTFLYERVAAMLASGRQAWVYVHRPPDDL
jgi:gamma-glutamylcyclotransferase (GGCT)/AIG2-like uncharacterized protein YtfP